LRRIRLFASQIVVVGILAAAGVVTAGALAGGGSPQNTTTKNGTGGGGHNTGGGQTSTAPTTETPPPSSSTQTPSIPVDPLAPVALEGAKEAQAKYNLTKDDMRENLRANTVMMAAFCQRAFTEPDVINYYWGGSYAWLCRLMIVIVLADSKIVRDPPDPNFMEVALSAPTLLHAVTVRCAKRVARRDCTALTAPLLRFINAVAKTAAATSGAATTLERFSGAAAAGSSPGVLLQSAAEKSYAGEVGSAFAEQQAAGRVLAAALRKARLDGPTNSRDLQAITKKLGSANGIPASIVSPLVAAGLTSGAAALSQILKSALQGLPKTIALTSFLGATTSTAALAKFHRDLTFPGLAAVVRALAKQGAIAQGTGETLLNDLRAGVTATTTAARTAALALFVQHAAVAQPAPAALLTAGAQALG
jgi:hypothetical protein